MEIVRVTQSSPTTWRKNCASVSFDFKNLKLPGFDRLYKVVSTCHHHGSINSGHWFTKVLTQKGWFEMDDLKAKCSTTRPPGVTDNSVTLILMVGQNKLRVSITMGYNDFYGCPG